MDKSELEKLRGLIDDGGLPLSLFRKMNILSEQREGWLVKQAYQEWLGRMYAEGYISEAEHDARMAWTEAARTERELRAAVADLPPRIVPGKPASPPEEKKKSSVVMTWAADHVISVTVAAATLTVVITLGCVLGNWYALPIACLALLAFL